MRKETIFKLSIIAIITILILPSCTTTTKTATNEYTMLEPAKTWVVLMEMNDFPKGYSDLPIDFINSKQMKEMFEKLGIQEDHILVKRDDMSIQSVKDSITWMKENSNENDTVFFYIASHGSWLRNKLLWNKLIAPEWNTLEERKKILMVDSCMAGEFITGFKGDKASGISIAAVGEDELGWWGVEEEGLPIIGSIWVKYFTEAVFNEEADVDNDGMITINEAFGFATPQLQQYMKEKVFAKEEFLRVWHRMGQYPEKSDGYPNPVIYSHLDDELVLSKLK